MSPPTCPGCGESDRVTDVGDRDGYWYDYHCGRCGHGWDEVPAE